MSPRWKPKRALAAAASVLAGALFCAEVPTHSPILLPQGSAETRKIAGVTRVAVADGRIARVRVAGPDALLITGLKAGRTQVRAWAGADADAQVIEVSVVPAEMYPEVADGADAPVARVLVEFLELSFSLGESLGLRWPEALQFGASAALSGGAFTGLNYSVTFGSSRAWIEHLCREGWARLLARPEIHVRLGEEARFHAGGEIPVPSSIENYGNSHRHVEWKKYGITVRVRPQSADSIRIRSDLRVEISEPDPALGRDGIPALTRRELETRMASRDGETVVLSGLVRESRSRETEGLPFLAGLPLVGWLFGTRRTAESGGETFLAVTISLRTPARNAEAVEEARRRWGEGSP